MGSRIWGMRGVGGPLRMVAAMVMELVPMNTMAWPLRVWGVGWGGWGGWGRGALRVWWARAGGSLR